VPQLRVRLAAVQTELENERVRFAESSKLATDCDDIENNGIDGTKNAGQDALDDRKHKDKASEAGKAGSRPKSPTAGREVHRQDLEMTVLHLKLLLDFIDEDLRDVLELRSQISSGTPDDILFEDLWHLFQPGDLILSTRGPNQQLFRLCAVTGGAVQLRNHTTEELDRIDRLRGQAPRGADDVGLEDILREEASGLGVWTPFTIDCYLMAFDGTEIGPLDHCKRIKHYSGKRSVRDLDVYPLRFHPNSEELLKQMEERGRKVLNSYGHKRYRGVTIDRSGTEILDEITSDVFIDMKTFFTSMPWNTPLMAPWSSRHRPRYGEPETNRLDLGRMLRTKPNPTETSERYGRSEVTLTGHEVDAKLSEDFMAANRVDFQARRVEFEEISPLQLQLLQYPVAGYAFRYRRWGKSTAPIPQRRCLATSNFPTVGLTHQIVFMDIDLVKDIDLEREARDSGFNELVIPQRYRDLLVALVDNHISGSKQAQTVDQTTSDDEPVTNQIDLVKGKGQGVIILLHGPPGSGKTSTAETIAAYTKRPLYHLTFGDIGTTPEDVETNLVAHAKRANKWGCVLLLDEADVFLRQRDWDNMEHNALVSGETLRESSSKPV